MSNKGFFGSKASLFLLLGLLVIGLEILGSVVYYSLDRALGLMLIFCGVLVVCLSLFVGFLILISKLFHSGSKSGAE